MVVGLEKFREFFAEFHDSYTIIGGATCDISGWSQFAHS